MGSLTGKHQEVSEEAESNLEEKLNKLNFNLPEDQPDDEDEPTPDDVSDDDVNEDVDSEDEDDTTPDDEDDGSKDEDTPPEVQIPEGYIRAAKRQGWTDEDIEAITKSDPDRAKRLFQNAYETVNKVTRDFAAIGRERAEKARKEAEEKDKENEPEIKDYIKPDEIEKIADGDEAIATVLTTMNKIAKEHAAEITKLRKAGPSTEDLELARSNQVAETLRAKNAADEADTNRIHQFFSSDSMKQYSDFYGTIKKGQNIDDITPNQRNHRIEVLQIADQLMFGKKAQGIDISVSEALEDAHLLVTEPIREKIIADKIKSSLKKRSKSKTLRPSSSKKGKDNLGLGKAKNREEAIQNAEQRLRKIFG